MAKSGVTCSNKIKVSICSFLLTKKRHFTILKVSKSFFWNTLNKYGQLQSLNKSDAAKQGDINNASKTHIIL